MNDPANSRANPRIGGTWGYPLWFRMRVLMTAANVGNAATANHLGVCERSIYKWLEELKKVPSLATTNFYLQLACSFVQMLLPMSSACLFMQMMVIPIYSRAQISDRCQELNITRKRASKEDYDAFSPGGLKKLHFFNTQGPPLGVHNVPIHQLIEVKIQSQPWIIKQI